MAFLLVNYFKGWLSISKKMIAKRDFCGQPEVPLEYIPFYILKLPESNDTGIEFHWWIHNEPNEYELECPFNTVKKQRNYRYKQIQYIEDPVKMAVKKL